MSDVELSAIVPLPAAVADNRAAAFARLAGDALLARVVRTMLGPARVSEQRRMVVATAKPLIDEARECLAAHELSSVAVVDGAADRRQCIAAGLEYLARESISTQFVLVHDYRRPLTPADVCDRVVARLRSGSAVVVPALPLTDSVKAVDSRGRVIGTVDRSTLATAQYPRGFTVDRLAQLVATRPAGVFDEVKEAIRTGLQITVVEGDPDAFVVDVPHDAHLVEAIIAARQAERR